MSKRTILIPLAILVVAALLLFAINGHWTAWEGGRSEKARVADQTANMTEQASTPSSICLSDPQGRDEAVAQEGAQK